MRIFIDIGHPAHVHYFKNIIRILEEDYGAHFFVTSRNKEMAHYLLKKYRIPFCDRGKGKDSILGKFLYLFKANYQIFKLAKKKKPQLFLSFGSPYAAQVSFLLGVPSITVDDTENAKLGQLFYKPFSKLILSPTTFCKDFGKKHQKFNGYMELCYLHPHYFEPDIKIYDYLNLKEGDIYSIVRFVKWKANHDIGHQGISNQNKIILVKELMKFGKVFITSENKLPIELEKYRIKIPLEKIHSALFYSKLLFSESATMASESAVLGTPAIYVDNVGRGYTYEQENKYGLVFNFTEGIEDQKASILKACEILGTYNQNEWTKKRDRLLREKIDFNEYLIEMIKKMI